MMIMGAALLIAALSLFIHNRQEAARAEAAAEALLPRVMEQIEARQAEPADGTEQIILPGTPVEMLDPSALEMTEVEIDGYGYVGYLSIPALGLELPIMGGWDYTRLNIAPCRYTGTARGEDLVLMAHNYARHFGRLSELAAGDQILFTDMDGSVYSYEVIALDILAPTAVEEMTAGEFDLTLFTCTYGGRSRVTVYCDLVKQ